MSLVQSWGEKEERDLTQETDLENLYSLAANEFKELCFACLRAGHVEGLRNLLAVDPHLLSAPLHGFEGADTKGVINAPSGRVYTYTGHKRDGFFFPLHVAAEGGNKLLTMLLLQAGADASALDYRGRSAKDVATGKAVHAFLEMAGMVFEAGERYQGALDRFGKRTRQGALYFKAEGYYEKEHILYTGSWKENLYDGNGTLYYPGTDIVRYVGRFKAGNRHGRGVEMDSQGRKIYSGGFRDDMREGRGEEYDPDFGHEDSAISATTTDAVTLTRLNSLAELAEPTLVYKGEFSKGEKHGFGIRYYPGGNKYIGRFDHNNMCGIGIFLNANGDRFEGMFVNDRLEGPASTYSYDPSTGREVAKHYMYTAGGKDKELTTPFVPKVIDLPADHLADKLAAMGLTTDEDSTKSTKRTKIDEMFHAKSNAYDWKKKLGKYLRLKASEAREFMLISKSDKTDDGSEDASEEEDSDGSDAGDREGKWADEQDAMDDITGYHFVDIPGLFVAYAYVTAAAKVLESREVTRQLHKMPDFEEVYHLVIDAVDTYNDAWENEYRKTVLERGSGGGKTEGREALVSPREGVNVQNKKQVYMSAAQIKEEVLEKQRVELAIKQGDLHLDPAVEQDLGSKAMESLKRELNLLIEMYMHEGEEKKAKLTDSGSEEATPAVSDGPAFPLPANQLNDRSRAMQQNSGPAPASGGAVSFTSKIGPQDKSAFAAELLEIITTATSFFNA